MAETPVCKVQDCGNPVLVNKHKLCRRHYRRLLRHGDPGSGASVQSNSREVAVFLAMATSSQTDDCIIWPFSTSARGYGKATHHGRSAPAHRIVLAEVTGQQVFDNPRIACHLPIICHQASCINPRHLRWGDARMNQRDRKLDGTDNVGEQNGRSILTEVDVVQIRKLYAVGGASQGQLADIFGVSRSAIKHVVNGKSWKAAA